MLNYIRLEELCRDVRENLWKVPRDIIGIVGVPRSGMLPATMIAEYLNIGLTTLDEFTTSNNPRGLFHPHGGRPIRQPEGNKVLVIDDTCYGGSQIQNVKTKIYNRFGPESEFEFVYLVAYLEGPCLYGSPDIYLRDVRPLAEESEAKIVLYEWNLLAHPRIMEFTLFDMDGVFCLDPPDERITEAYESYIKNPTPLFSSNTWAGKPLRIVTYRLEKYRQETEESLRNMGIDAEVNMFASNSYEERRATPPQIYKAEAFSNSNAILFVESDDWQARKICQISGKSVFCTGTNTMYNP